MFSCDTTFLKRLSYKKCMADRAENGYLDNGGETDFQVAITFPPTVRPGVRYFCENKFDWIHFES